MKKFPRCPIKVLNKSLSILEILLQQGSSINMTEISEKLEIYPSSTHRILDTFKEESSQTIRMISYVGKRAPSLYCFREGAVSPSLNGRKKMLGEKVLPRLTENTITDK